MMKNIFENWKRFLKESVKDLKHISAGNWSTTEAEDEWHEEIKKAIKDDGIIKQRWPGLSKNVIEKSYPFLLTPEDFGKEVSSAGKRALSPSEMKEIWNHAQVYDIIELYEKDVPSEEIEKKIFDFFKQLKTAVSAGGKVYPKEQSYMRWVKHFKETNNAKKPPILIELPDGRLAHIAGQTRQTGALTNKKIIPYVVLTAKSKGATS